MIANEIWRSASVQLSLKFGYCPSWTVLLFCHFINKNSSSLGQIRAFIFYLRCSKCVSSLANYHSQIRYGLRLIKLHNFSLPKRTLEYQIDGHILTRTRGSFLPLSLFPTFFNRHFFSLWKTKGWGFESHTRIPKGQNLRSIQIGHHWSTIQPEVCRCSN